jgi:NAD(P)-dependent dehydrogenase (short-subunit alcohol dehydrogenase family)
MVYATYPDLADKRVLITGGGTGIGAGIDAFAQQGAQVFFVDIAVEASKQLAESLKGGKHACVRHCDLTDLKALSGVIAQSRKTTARLKS